MDWFLVKMLIQGIRRCYVSENSEMRTCGQEGHPIKRKKCFCCLFINVSGRGCERNKTNNLLFYQTNFMPWEEHKLGCLMTVIKSGKK